MAEVVIDASALLALLNAEPGSDVVAERLSNAVISSVNYSEVISKLAEEKISENTIIRILEPLGLDVIPFTEDQAFQAGLLRSSTKSYGLSMGDRACLSLGKGLKAEILTADKAWAGLAIGVKILVIR